VEKKGKGWKKDPSEKGALREGGGKKRFRFPKKGSKISPRAKFSITGVYYHALGWEKKLEENVSSRSQREERKGLGHYSFRKKQGCVPFLGAMECGTQIRVGPVKKKKIQSTGFVVHRSGGRGSYMGGIVAGSPEGTITVIGGNVMYVLPITEGKEKGGKSLKLAVAAKGSN